MCCPLGLGLTGCSGAVQCLSSALADPYECSELVIAHPARFVHYSDCAGHCGELGVRLGLCYCLAPGLTLGLLCTAGAFALLPAPVLLDLPRVRRFGQRPPCCVLRSSFGPIITRHCFDPSAQTITRRSSNTVAGYCRGSCERLACVRCCYPQFGESREHAAILSQEILGATGGSRPHPCRGLPYRLSCRPGLSIRSTTPPLFHRARPT